MDEMNGVTCRMVAAGSKMASDLITAQVSTDYLIKTLDQILET